MKKQGIQTYYFIGIGGVGMSALARLCKRQGHEVFGYDKTPSSVTKDLEQEGILITYDGSMEALPKEVLGADVEVVYTAAISEDHPQLMYYASKGNRIRKRAVFLADSIQNSKVLAVAGTHGKTTTSAILTHIFSVTKQSFSSFMGGFLNGNDSNLIGEGDEFMIVEADEYDRSFLKLHPSIGSITSMDADHLDIYETAEAFEAAFIQFSQQIEHNLIHAYGLPLMGLTFGIDVEADYKAFNIHYRNMGYSFDLNTPKGLFKEITFNQIGKHNITNAVCAIAMADQAGIPMESTLKALETFPGVYRRMNVFEWKNALVIDDYAHHPTEIRKVFETLKECFSGQKNCVIFQPHLFSRTQDFLDGFLRVLAAFDEVILLDIYPAREEPIPGISSRKILEHLKHSNKKLIEKKEIKEVMESSEATVFAFLGAGDIGVEVQSLKNQFVIK